MTLLELARKLNGEVENDKINLNSRGYNTDKMQTEISVSEWAEGKFVADCKITCSTQNSTWIEKEQDKIEDSLNKEMKLLTQVSFLIVSENGLYVDEDAYMSSDKDDAKVFFSEKYAKKFLDKHFLEGSTIIMNNN